jgi:hypothetical protein
MVIRRSLRLLRLWHFRVIRVIRVVRDINVMNFIIRTDCCGVKRLYANHLG